MRFPRTVLTFNLGGGTNVTSSKGVGWFGKEEEDGDGDDGRGCAEGRHLCGCRGCFLW